MAPPVFYNRGRYELRYITMKDYNSDNISLAKSLRKNMTRHEKHLWYDFLSFHHIKFRRQTPLGNYIADFYAPEIKLVIEVDGRGHMTEENQAYDKVRTAAFEAMGVSVLRISNESIDKDFHHICNFINDYIHKLNHR